MEKLQKLTKTDFETFKKECNKWIKILGLYGWDMNYKMEDLDGDRAHVSGMYEGRLATVFINSDADSFFFKSGSITKLNEIKSSAKHEILELFLYRLRAMAFDRNINKDEWNAETHQIIHTLDRLL